MKKNITTLMLGAFILLVAACGGEAESKLNESEQKAVETQVQKDQAAMDSLEKAIQSQIDAMPDDSLMKEEH